MFEFAIVGCGRIAERHAENINRIAKLTAVCDVVKSRADDLAKKYNAKAYYNITDLLSNQKKLDVASVCTPNGLHAAHSIQCLHAGINVLCEKPLCIKTEDGNEMIAAAEKAKKKLFVVKSTRYNPALIQMKKLLEEGRLGSVYSFQLSCFWNRPSAYYYNTWKGSLQMDGGTLYTQFSHYIDVMYWLFGDVKVVQGIRKNYAHKQLIEFEDSGVVALEMQNGIMGTLNYSVNTFIKNMEVSLTVIAEKGTIKLGGEYMNEINYQLIEGLDFIEVSKSQEANDYGFYKGSMSNHDKVYENLLLALKDEKHLFTTAVEGLKTVSIIEKIYRECRLIVD